MHAQPFQESLRQDEPVLVRVKSCICALGDVGFLTLSSFQQPHLTCSFRLFPSLLSFSAEGIGCQAARLPVGRGQTWLRNMSPRQLTQAIGIFVFSTGFLSHQAHVAFADPLKPQSASPQYSWASNGRGSIFHRVEPLPREVAPQTARCRPGRG